MKTFASRPIRDVALKGFIGKVKAKQDADRASTREVNRGDDLYPHERVVKALSRERGVQEVFSKKWISEESTQLPSTSTREVNRGDDLYPHERVVKALSRERGVQEVRNCEN
ncbi:unnamed protein product [Haemonchus placei]|uniref:Chromo domain-containing protein n=1 Tax=Haemonchus placei TaxID=6290 RepID=A0A0N4XC02_HAEPC|nr:unnamed protein product [Haemonchus placei]